MASTLSEDEDVYVTPTDVKNYFFCQQQPYINHVLGIAEPPTHSMLLSKEFHENFDSRMLPKSLKPLKIVKGLSVVRQDVRLRGRLDALLLTKYGEAVPCDFKLGHAFHKNPPSWDKMQLTAYALLVEHALGKVVRRGLFYYAEMDSAVVIQVTHSMKREVMDAIERILEIIVNGFQPSGRRYTYCKGCWYNVVCRTA